MAQTARHIIFQGRVQGVGFRFTARNAGQKHKIAGFVRNLPDGTVEMWAQGPRRDVEAAISEIQSVFSRHIDNQRIEEVEPNAEYSSFHIAF